MIHDPELLDAIAALPVDSFDGSVFRATGLAADPTVFSYSGGRWAPADEEEGGFPGLDVEVLLYFLALFTAKRGIGENDVVAVFFLYAADVFAEGVDVDDVGRVDAVEDHVHDSNDVGHSLLLLAIEGPLLQGLEVVSGEFRPSSPHVLEGLAQETRRPDGPVIDGLPNLGISDSNHRAD